MAVPGYPHHIIQRGARSIDLFYLDDDGKEYLLLIKQTAERFGVEFISYCLMTNHIHLVAIPSQTDSLARAGGIIFESSGSCTYRSTVWFR